MFILKVRIDDFIDFLIEKQGKSSGQTLKLNKKFRKYGFFGKADLKILKINKQVGIKMSWVENFRKINKWGDVY